MNLRLRGWTTTVGLTLLAFSVASAFFIMRGGLSGASPEWFVCLLIGASGVPAAVGCGIVINQQQLSVRVKRNVIAISIVFIGIAGFALLFLIMASGYGQMQHSHVNFPKLNGYFWESVPSRMSTARMYS